MAEGAALVQADRSLAGAYDEVADRDWDAVIDVCTRQPGFARRAAADLGARAAHWTFISSGNVYASHHEPGADEAAELMVPLQSDESTPDTYGEAKSAIKAAYRDALGDRLLIVRPGLIAGPGDASGRSGYWVARAARDDGPILIPDILDAPVQAIHVDDLVRFTLDGIEQRRTGAFNAVGDRTTFGDWLARSRMIAGHRGEVVAAAPEWLAEQGVAGASGRTHCRSGSSTPSGTRSSTGPTPRRSPPACACARSTNCSPRPSNGSARRASTESAARGSARRASESCSRHSGGELGGIRAPAPCRADTRPEYAAGMIHRRWGAARC